MKKILFSVVVLALLTGGFATGSAQTSAPDPIIIIPGIGSSWDTSGMLDFGSVDREDWHFLAGVNTYDSLIEQLEN